MHSCWLKGSGEGHVREWLRKKNRDLLLKKRTKKRAERREREERESEVKRKEERTAQAKEVYAKWLQRKAEEGREKGRERLRKEKEEKQKEQAQERASTSFSASSATNSRKKGAGHQLSVRRDSPNLPRPVKKTFQERREESERERRVSRKRD